MSFMFRPEQTFSLHDHFTLICLIWRHDSQEYPFQKLEKVVELAHQGSHLVLDAAFSKVRGR